MKPYRPLNPEDIMELRRLMSHLQQNGRPGSMAHYNQSLVKDHFSTHAITYIGRLLATVEQMTEPQVEIPWTGHDRRFPT